MFKDAIYIDGRVVRSVEDSAELEMLLAPYVYRTVRTHNYAPEQPNAETQSLNNAFGEVFGLKSSLNATTLTTAVESVLTRNHYPSRLSNVEVRLHRLGSRAVMSVVAGEVLDQDHYDAAVLRPSAEIYHCEIPWPQHFTSFGRQIIDLMSKSSKEVCITLSDGALRACEGFPLYGVVGEQVVVFAPWESIESHRAERVCQRAGISLVRKDVCNPSEVRELFYFSTNELVSIGRLAGRPLEPFVAFRLSRFLNDA